LTAREVATVQRLPVAPLLLERQGSTTDEAAERLGLSVPALRAQLATLQDLGVVAESAGGRWYLLDIGALALQTPTVAPQAPAGRPLTLVSSPA
ncbi:MAG: winged helix-turn-helix domain-containing protein, partial [Actinomycetota bacterium]|nr:winged helix-turn-helix domain-containing protein [Actinomycetota bacterium]